MRRQLRTSLLIFPNWLVSLNWIISINSIPNQGIKGTDQQLRQFSIFEFRTWVIVFVIVVDDLTKNSYKIQDGARKSVS